jgi:3-oxoacyl-[acyl-carrier protein] reductase
MDLGLKGKVALITGASKGLGRAIAEEFAKEGAHVSICARGREDLEKAAEGLRQHGVSVAATSADVTRAEDVQRAIDVTIKQLGRIDILVNNAGDIWFGHSVDTTDKEW